jgi:glutamine synthetase
MDVANILNYVASHPSKRVKIAVTDIDGILRGKYISADKFTSIFEKGMGFCDVIFGWDMGDALYEKGQISGWHSGFPDSPTVLDVHTFRKIPWENDLPFFLGEMDPLSSHAAAV